MSRGPTSGGDHSAWTGFSPWDFFPLSLDEGIHTLAVGNGTATLMCDDGYQATVELVTEQGDVFHYAHLDADSVADAGITSDGVAVLQGADMGTLFHDTDGWSYACGSGTGPHLHFEIESDALPMVIDGYTFSLADEFAGESLASTNGAPVPAPPAVVGTATNDVDFNGDGYHDVAIGVPSHTVDGLVDAGKVHVLYGSGDGLSVSAGPGNQSWTQNSSGVEDVAEAGDQFGAAVSTGDFNGDGYHDLLIGAPGEDINGKADVGAVHILYGSSSGLSATATRNDQRFTQNSTDIADVIQAGDEFGAAVSTGDFNGDGYVDVVIGAYGEDVNGKSNAGSVHVIYGSSNGLSATATRADQRFTQNSAGIADVVESDDRFGAAVTTGDFNRDGYHDLLVGAPGEDVNGKNDVGAVHVIYGSSDGLSATATRNDQRFTQNSSGIIDVVQAGDQFGAAVTTGDFNGDGYIDVAISAHGENMNGKADVGGVHIIYGSSNGLSASATRADQRFTQNSTGIADVIEAGDQFGAAVTTGDFNGDGYADLLVGVPGEDVNGKTDVGAVHIIYGSSDGLSATATRNDQRFTQNSTDVAGAIQDHDAFGLRVTADDFNADGNADVVIGAPGENVGGKHDAGVVHVIYGHSSGVSPTAARSDQLFSGNTSGLEGTAGAGDRFGGQLNE